jgi:hypothetical protein
MNARFTVNAHSLLNKRTSIFTEWKRRKTMSANERSTDRQAKAGVPYNHYRRKAHQARADFLAGSFIALRRSLSEALAGHAERIRAYSAKNRSQLD